MLGKIEPKGKGAVYLRVSTTTQDLSSQKMTVGSWVARQRSLTLNHEYAEKISGAGGYVRKELNAMIADARANKFNVAIFNDMSRLGRNVYEAMQIVHEFHDANVKVAIVDIDMVWDLDDPVCNLIAGTMLAVAQFESDEGKKRTRRGMQGKAKQIAANIKAGKLPKGARCGLAGIIEKYVKDPNARLTKKGLLVAPDEERRAMFELIWTDTRYDDAYHNIATLLRIPRNPKCNYKCKGKPGPASRLVSSWEKVTRSLTAKCYCGLKPSRKTIHKTRVALGLPVRNPHSFKRGGAESTSHDITMADYLPDDEAAAAAPA